MNELRSVVSDEAFAKLDPLAQEPRVSLEELVKRSLAAYMAHVKAEPDLEPLPLACGPIAQRCKTRPPLSKTSWWTSGRPQRSRSWSCATVRPIRSSWPPFCSF
jgi:hypothetical protein